MPNNKQLISLDEECISILSNKPNKSSYVRDAIKEYTKSKSMPKPIQKATILEVNTR